MKKGIKLAVLLLGTLVLTETATAAAWFGWGTSRRPYHRRNYYVHGYSPWYRRSVNPFDVVFGTIAGISRDNGRVQRWEDVQAHLQRLYNNDEITKQAFDDLKKAIGQMQEDFDNMVKDVKNLVKDVEDLKAAKQ